MTGLFLKLVALVAVVSVSLPVVWSNPHAKRLYTDLLVKSGYNKLIRPVAMNNHTLTVKLGLKLSQLIGIDEKNQIMTTNVWLSQEWIDNSLRWDTREYDGVDQLHVPAEDLWKPDIVLYNNADGNYQVTLMTKATVHSTGRVVWEPPAIYKSSCNIDVEFFPFDIQTCEMKFSSWTYDGFLVDLKHIDQADIEGEVDIPMAMDMTGYYRSFIWDVLSVPARRNEVNYPCCPEFYPDVTFRISIRRKTLFYTVNLIIPCVAISFLTVMVFYLPSDSGEKITLCISILLSLTVFFLLLADLIPPTSIVTPLIGRYLLFTMILVTLSIIITVVVLNVHNRSSTTHTMSPWVRRVFLFILPRLLLMKQPMISLDGKSKKKSSPVNRTGNIEAKGESAVESETLLTNNKTNPSPFPQPPSTKDNLHPPSAISPSASPQPSRRKKVKYPPEIEKALDGVLFIAQHLRDEDADSQTEEDWKYVAMVIDRFFLWLFTSACIVGTLGIILQAPTLYDERKAMDVGI